VYGEDERYIEQNFNVAEVEKEEVKSEYTKEMSVENIKLNVLIYGKSGTGKTTFACCFPKPFVFDFDKGMLSQRGKDVDYVTYGGPTAYADFEVKFKELERSCPYDTIILDSVTTLEEYCMDRALAANRRAMPTMNEWNVLIADLKDLFMRATKMSKHLVVIAHEQMIQDEITGEVMVRPQIVGKKLPAQLPLWFDECYRAQVSRDKEGRPIYSLLTSADLKYTAKSRINCLPSVLDWSKDGKMLNAYELIIQKIGEGSVK
jgi:hypothetical protein